MRVRARLSSWWEALRGSFWFIPSAMAIGAVILGFAMVSIDASVPADWVAQLPGLYTGTADGARTVLATIASSMIGLAGVVFSITIVALTLASNQFGPPLLRNFMRDRGNQITLGTFLAAFLYCLLVLRQVQGGNGPAEDGFVPQLSMLLAVVIAIGGLGVLIFFIHHAAASIQAPNVIAAVADELFEAIGTLYPERLGQHPETAESSEAAARAQVPENMDQQTAGVLAGSEGFVQRIEAEQLMGVAQSHDLLVRIVHRPGQFVQRDDEVLSVWPPERLDDAVRQALRECFVISNQRSLTQDAEFAIEQLVEVAVRALSPGINDPFTAMQCVDRLGAALSELSTRHLPSRYRVDPAGRLRVLAYPTKFSNYVDSSFNQIRQYAANSLDVLLRMLEAIERVVHRSTRLGDRQRLAEHAALVYQAALEAAATDEDRGDVQRRYARVKASLSRC